MATPAQIEKHIKLCLRKKAFNLAVLQLIGNDSEDFQKRIARMMVECGMNRGNVIAESKLAISDFVNSL
jgi:hypothetical protein